MARKSKRTALITTEPPKQKMVYMTAIYLRLSVEEKRDKKDSESLENQKQICLDYLNNKENMQVYKVYCDNGETGTNFEREAFQEMMYDVYQGKVNCIIVKDLSRFGREYVEAGDYLEKIFPLIGVRFIAINDNYDNQVTAFDISVPIKNIINTLYARDLSRKSSTALRIKQQNGEFIGSYAAYGYMKSDKDKHKIVIDTETAPVVKMIFEWKDAGESYVAIRRKLYDMKIMPPCRYRYEKGILKDKRYAEIEFWSMETLKKILKNEVYIGNLVQGRRKSHFFDGKQTEKVDRKDWVIAEHTHEPIISKELFDRVQKQLEETKANYRKNLGKYDTISNQENIFKGKLMCGDCGSNLVRYKTAKKDFKKAKYSYICPHHSLFPEQCSFFSMDENVLKDIVMTAIKTQISHLANMEKMFLDIAGSTAVRKKQMELNKTMGHILTSISYIKTSRIRITTDLAKGVIDEEEYELAKKAFDEQLCSEEKKLNTVRKERDAFDKIISAPKWIAGLKKYHDIKILTRELVEAFIEKIRIYPDKRMEILWTYQEKQSELTSLLLGGVEVAS